MAEQTDKATLPPLVPPNRSGKTESEGDAALDAALAEYGIDPGADEELEDTAAPPDDEEGHDEPDPDASEDKPEDTPGKTDSKPDEKPDPQAKDDPPVLPNLTSRQRQVAKELDLSDDDLLDMGDMAPDLIDRMGVKLSTQMAKLGREAQDDPDDKASEDEDKGDKPDKGSGKLPKLEDLTDDDLYESSPDKMNAHVAHTRNHADRLERVEAWIQGEQDRRESSETEGFFQGVVKDFPRYGKGRTGNLAETSDERAARNEVIEEAKTIRTGYRFRKKDIGWLDALEAAHKQLSFNETQDKATRTQARHRKNRRSTRPSGRPPISPTETAEEQQDKAFDEYVAKSGMPVETR